MQAEEEAEGFMKEEHTFLEYEKQVYRYQELVSELQYEVEKVCMYHDQQPNDSHHDRQLTRFMSSIIQYLGNLKSMCT